MSRIDLEEGGDQIALAFVGDVPPRVPPLFGCRKRAPTKL